MYFVKNASINYYYNLGLEELLLKDTTDEFCMLWKNKDVVIVGRNQNVINEVDIKYAKKHNINITRRCSGGGAVYHDLGNLNFSFILNSSNFDKLSVINNVNLYLNNYGVESKVTDRLDLLVDGKKISGTAICKYKSRVLFHGTLLYDSNLTHLNNVLNGKVERNRYIKSKKCEVCNICDFVNVASFDTFKDGLYKHLNDIYNFKDYDCNFRNVVKYSLKYKDPDWISINKESSYVMKRLQGVSYA